MSKPTQDDIDDARNLAVTARKRLSPRTKAYKLLKRIEWLLSEHTGMFDEMNHLFTQKYRKPVPLTPSMFICEVEPRRKGKR